jgi:protein gp37
MGKTTIEWTDYTWNPWYGCHKVSEGCKNCYMFREMKWHGKDPNIVQRSKTFYDPLKWAKTWALDKQPIKVFTCSWSDFFIKEADPWRDKAWDIIKRTPNLVYQILTKRPENIETRLPEDWKRGYPNVWLGVSIENQKTANKRLPLLMDTPAVVRFVSCEPLLEYVDLVKAVHPDEWAWDEVNADPDDCEPEEFIEECEAEFDWVNYGDNLVVNPEYQEWERQHMRQAQYITFKREINWVICGGETGAGARPMHIEWVRALRDQCTKVAFFFKSWGEFRPLSLQDDMDRLAMIMAPGLEAMARIGRRKSGRLLDGIEWNEFPTEQYVAIGHSGN